MVYGSPSPRRREARNEAKVVVRGASAGSQRPAQGLGGHQPGSPHGRSRGERHRVWYVASRAAAELGDLKTASGRKLFEAIQKADPAFPALDELDRVTRGV